MNDYDARHLRLLDLIDAQRWHDLTPPDLDEVRVLMACKYVVLQGGAGAGLAPTLSLNPEGHHYHDGLRLLADRYQRLSQ